MKTARWIVASAALLAAGWACTTDLTGGGGAQPGTLTVRLTTPHADDGAMTFQVSGAPIDSAVIVNASSRLFTRREDGSTLVGAVVGALANGPMIILYVPDVRAAAQYTATVREVADQQDALRAALTGYRLTVAFDSLD